jgi:trigger factor
VKSSVESLDDNKVKLSVEVPAEDLEAAIDVAFRKIAKEIRLPGFRPGKAPRKVLEARIGKGYARAQAIEDTVPGAYERAVIEHDVDVIAQPAIELTAGEEEGPLAFDAVVEIRPTIAVVGYQSVRVEIDPVEVTTEEIDQQIDVLRGRFGELQEVDRPAASGDTVTIDIATTQDGNEVSGLTASDFDFEIGRGFVVPQLDENLEGAEAGQELNFEAQPPSDSDDDDDDDDDDDEDAESPLVFAITVKAVKAKVLPELDDDFVKEASEFTTVDELLADTRQRLALGKRARARNQVADKLTTELAALVDGDVSEALVSAEIQAQIRDMAMRMASQGVRLEQWLQMTGQTPADLMENLQEPAERSAKVDPVLRAVAVAESIELPDEELDAEIEATAAQVGQSADVVRAQFVEGGQLSSIRWDMRKQKAMTWLLERATIVDTEGTAIVWDELKEPEPEAADTAADDETDQPENTESGADASATDDETEDKA